MKTRATWIAVMCLAALPLAAQSPAVPTMDHEPHHHLALHNDHMKVFNVLVSPGDSIILHSHDQDTVAIAISEQLVPVGLPGKPDVHSKNLDAQVRLQRSSCCRRGGSLYPPLPSARWTGFLLFCFSRHTSGPNPPAPLCDPPIFEFLIQFIVDWFSINSHYSGIEILVAHASACGFSSSQGPTPAS